MEPARKFGVLAASFALLCALLVLWRFATHPEEEGWLVLVGALGYFPVRTFLLRKRAASIPG